MRTKINNKRAQIKKKVKKIKNNQIKIARKIVKINLEIKTTKTNEI